MSTNNQNIFESVDKIQIPDSLADKDVNIDTDFPKGAKSKNIKKLMENFHLFNQKGKTKKEHGIGFKHVGYYFAILENIGEYIKRDLLEITDEQFKKISWDPIKTKTLNYPGKPDGATHDDFMDSLNQGGILGLADANISVARAKNNRQTVLTPYLILRRFAHFVDASNYIKDSRVLMEKYRLTLAKALYILAFLKDQIVDKGKRETQLEKEFKKLLDEIHVNNPIFLNKTDIIRLKEKLNSNGIYRTKLEEKLNSLYQDMASAFSLETNDEGVVQNQLLALHGNIEGLTKVADQLIDAKIDLSKSGLIFYSLGEGAAYYNLYNKLNSFQKRELKYAIQNAIREKLGFYTNTFHADNKIALKGGSRKAFFSHWNKIGGANVDDLSSSEKSIETEDDGSKLSTSKTDTSMYQDFMKEVGKSKYNFKDKKEAYDFAVEIPVNENTGQLNTKGVMRQTSDIQGSLINKLNILKDSKNPNSESVYINTIDKLIKKISDGNLHVTAFSTPKENGIYKDAGEFKITLNITNEINDQLVNKLAKLFILLSLNMGSNDWYNGARTILENASLTPKLPLNDLIIKFLDNIYKFSPSISSLNMIKKINCNEKVCSNSELEYQSQDSQQYIIEIKVFLPIPLYDETKLSEEINELIPDIDVKIEKGDLQKKLYELALPKLFEHPKIKGVFKHSSNQNKQIAEIYLNYISKLKHNSGKNIKEYNTVLYQKLIERIISKDEKIPNNIKDEIRNLI